MRGGESSSNLVMVMSVDTLMRMQNSYDIAKARKREGEIKVARFKGKVSEQKAVGV